MSVVIMSIGTLMLIAPLWILQALQSLSSKPEVITAFIVLFLGMILWVTVAKPVETLAAAAAYVFCFPSS